MNCFVVANPDKCIGCRTCEIACVVAHSDKSLFTAGTAEVEFNPRLKVIKTATVSAPIQCRHCENAPCANVCPVGAITNKGNSIQVDPAACVGCKTCMLACPFGAIDLVSEYYEGEKCLQEGLKISQGAGLCAKDRIIANKCDLCVDRPGGPACIEVCPTAAFQLVKNDNMANSIQAKRKQSVTELSILRNRR